MIIQGTTGTGKSYLIGCIKQAFQHTMNPPLLLLAPTVVPPFNIQASTIHAALLIPINQFRSLEGQSFSSFQEKLKHIHYILIDEMSFIGPKVFSSTDERLRCLVILVRDLAQRQPVKDGPLYAATSHGTTVWRSFQV